MSPPSGSNCHTAVTRNSGNVLRAVTDWWSNPIAAVWCFNTHKGVVAMTTKIETRHAVLYSQSEAMTSQELRDSFMIETLFSAGDINACYTAL